MHQTPPRNGPRRGTAAGEGWVRAYTPAAPFSRANNWVQLDDAVSRVLPSIVAAIVARQTAFTAPGAPAPGQHEDMK